jgi:hypothetical protein
MSKKINGSRIRQSKLVFGAVKAVKEHLTIIVDDFYSQIKGFLSAHTQKVEIINPDTSLIKEVAENTRKSNSRIGKLLNKDFTNKINVESMSGEIKIPKTIKVSNLKDIKPPSEIRVSNLGDISIPKTVKISNLDNISIPKPQKVDISPLEEALRGLKTAVLDTKGYLPKLKQKDLPKTKDVKQVGKHVEAMADRLDDALTSLYELIRDKDFGGNSQTVFKSGGGGSKYADVTVNGLRGVPQSTAVTVTTDATLLPNNSLINRRSLIIFNNSNNTVYIGGADVTTANGMPIASESYSPPIDASDQMQVYAIAGSSSEVRVLEVSTDKSGS